MVTVAFNPIDHNRCDLAASPASIAPQLVISPESLMARPNLGAYQARHIMRLGDYPTLQDPPFIPNTVGKAHLRTSIDDQSTEGPLYSRNHSTKRAIPSLKCVFG